MAIPVSLPAATLEPPTEMSPGRGPDVKLQPRLLDRMRQVIRVRHYSIRTEDTYVH